MNTPADNLSHPLPDPGAFGPPGQSGQERSEKLLEEIRQHHRSRLSFADYMRLALSHPRWGYYAGREQIFGRGGDFSTAPELSPVFAHCLARAWAELSARHARQNRPFEILEIGPGSGRLACQVLGELARMSALPSRYCLYEPSAQLATVQRARLEALSAEPGGSLEIVWLDGLDDICLQGVIFANEVADVLPVEILRRSQGRIEQLFVACDGSEPVLSEVWCQAHRPLQQQLEALESRLGRVFDDGYRIELHTACPDWLDQLARVLHSGQLWIGDYGYDEPNYYHPQRRRGTLRCHYRHHCHNDPLVLTGLQDISASVNFDRLYALARERGFELSLYRSQGRWLIETGALEQAGRSVRQAKSTLTRQKSGRAFMQLVMPDAMGELFKIAVFSRYR